MKRICGKAAASRLGWVRLWLEDQAVAHSCADKLEEASEELERPHNPGFQCGEIKPPNIWP